MATKVGDMYAELSLKKDKFEKNLTASQKRMQKFKQGATMAFKAIAVAVTAVTAAITKMVGDLVKYAEQMRAFAKATNMNIETLQEFAYAAKQEHADMESFTRGVKNLTIRLDYAGKGLETYTRYFDALGIEYKNADGTLRNITDVFLDLSDSISHGTLTTEKQAAALQLLGARAGQKLIPMLKKGREWFEKMGIEAHNLGIIMTKEDIEATKKFDDKTLALKESINALKREFALGLLPSLNSTADMLKDNALHAGGLRDSMRDIGIWIGKIGIILMRFVNNVREMMTDFGAHITNGIAGLLELGTHLPKIGKKFENAARSARILNQGFVQQGIDLQKNEDEYNTMLENLGILKEEADEASGSPEGDSPGGGINGLNKEIKKMNMLALTTSIWQDEQKALQELKEEMREYIQSLKDNKKETIDWANVAKVASENTGEMFATMIQSGGNVSAVLKRLIGQLIRMTILSKFGPIGTGIGGFMRVFGFQQGGMIQGMPMMNMRPNLAVANENPSTPELIVPIEKFKDLIQVNVKGAATADIFLDASKLPDDIKDKFTRDFTKPSLSRDNRRG